MNTPLRTLLRGCLVIALPLTAQAAKLFDAVSANNLEAATAELQRGAPQPQNGSGQPKPSTAPPQNGTAQPKPGTSTLQPPPAEPPHAPAELELRGQPDFFTPLQVAVSAGNPAMVKLLLDAGADPLKPGVAPASFNALQRAIGLGNSPWEPMDSRVRSGGEIPDPQLPLKRALSERDARAHSWAAMPDEEKARRIEVLKLLLEKKPELNKSYPANMPPLHLAAAAGNLEMVKLLLAAGAKTDVKDPSWATALSCAAEHSAPAAVIDALIAAGADVDSLNSEDVTPLMFAALAGSAPTVQSLIAHGALVDSEDNKRQTVISYAARGGQDAIVQLLHKKGGKALVSTMEQQNMLYLCAIMGGSKAAIEVLLQDGVEIDPKDSMGYTPLLTAAEKGRGELVKFLLEKGADRNAVAEGGSGLFEMACIGGLVDLAKETMAKGNPKKPGLLWRTVYLGKANTAALLLDAGADVNGANESGQGPLTAAIITPVVPEQPEGSRDQHAQLVQLILDHHPDLKAQDKNGLTALFLAARFGGAAEMKALIAAGGDIALPSGPAAYTPAINAAAFGRAETLQALLDAGADPNQLDAGEQSLVQIAAYQGNADTLKLLLDRKLPVNVKEKARGMTPLHAAAFGNSEECVRLLLAAGADPNALDGSGSTPLVAAIASKAAAEAPGAQSKVAPDTIKRMLNLQARLRIIHQLITAGAKWKDTKVTSPDGIQVIDVVEFANMVKSPEIVALLQNPPPLAVATTTKPVVAKPAPQKKK